jgi:hypothetical protein
MVIVSLSLERAPCPSILKLKGMDNRKNKPYKLAL